MGHPNSTESVYVYESGQIGSPAIIFLHGVGTSAGIGRRTWNGSPASSWQRFGNGLLAASPVTLVPFVVYTPLVLSVHLVSGSETRAIASETWVGRRGRAKSE
jgi:hypothetical protein